MADKARTWTDKKLKQMEKKISDIYEEAEADITKDWNEYMEKSASVIDKYQKAYDEAVKSGDKDLIKKASDELIKKKKEQTLRNDNYKEMVDATTTQIANANQTALAYVNDQTPSVYARNYAQVGDEFDIDFQGTHGSESIRKLTNEEMVKNLITEGDIQLPKKKLSVPKDKRWNTKQINSSVLQGILSGESMDKIADRLLPIIGRNSSAAIRNARTLVTGAENRGRQDSYERLEDEGVVMKKVWLATGDERTRSWHLDMDGQEKDPSDLFIDGNGNKLKYPGDPNAEPETVYNCRCSMKTKIIGFRKADGSISYVDFEDNKESLHEQQIKAEKNKRIDLSNPEEKYKYYSKAMNITNFERDAVNIGIYDEDTDTTTAAGYIMTDSSVEINNKLRNDKKLTKSEQVTVDALDNVISKNTLKENIVVNRGVSEDYIEAVFGIKPYEIDTLFDGYVPLEGVEITEKGFMSTTLDGIVNKFRTNSSQDDFILKLSAKKGTNAFFADNLAEGEVIFGQNTKYVITEYYINDDDQLVIKGNIL